jgi:hypothetical protein
VGEKVGRRSGILGSPIEPGIDRHPELRQCPRALTGKGVDERSVAVIEKRRELGVLVHGPVEEAIA